MNTKPTIASAADTILSTLKSEGRFDKLLEEFNKSPAALALLQKKEGMEADAYQAEYAEALLKFSKDYDE